MNLIKSSIVITIISLLVTVISFLNQVTIASFFGTSKELDLYFIAISFPLLIGSIIGLSFSYYLTPHFVVKKIEIKKELFSNYIGRFLINTNKYLLALVLPISLLFYIIIPKIYGIQDIDEISLIRKINLLAWISIIISINYSIFTSYLNSKKQFILPVILNSFPFLSSIVLIIFFQNKLGIVTAILGTVIGSMFGLLFLSKELRNFKFINRNKKLNKSVNIFYKNLRYAIIAMLCFSVFQFIDSFWVPKIGESAMSYVGYSQRLVIAIGSLVITGPSIVLIPRLTEKFKSKDYKGYFEDSSLVIRMVIILSTFFCLIFYNSSENIISILFERGQFDEISTSGVNVVFSLFLFGMIFMLTSVITLRILFTKEIDYSIAGIGMLTAISYFSFLGIFSNYFKLSGVGYAYILTWIFISFMTLYKLFHFDLKLFFNRELYVLVIKIFIVVIFISLLEYFINDLSVVKNYGKKINLIINTSTKILIELFLVLFLSIKIIKIQEIKFLFNKILK